MPQIYWYVGLAFSAAWSIGSVAWSITVERRLRRMRAELTDHSYVQELTRRELADVESYLGKTPTVCLPVLRKRVTQ